MLTALEMGFLAFIGLFVVVPVVAILSERTRRAPSSAFDDEQKRRLAELETALKQQQEQIQELKRLLTINILKHDDEESLHRRLDSGT